MKLLKEIYHANNIDLRGRTTFRAAVRSICVEDRQVLMVHSTKTGDYKFPGGGIQPGESHARALQREIREEIGMELTAILRPFGKVIEYDSPAEGEYDLFQMTSYYYWCNVDPITGGQELDPYEAELGFTPVWMDINSAIQSNRSLLEEKGRSLPRWVRREVFILELLEARLAASSASTPEKEKPCSQNL